MNKKNNSASLILLNNIYKIIYLSIVKKMKQEKAENPLKE